MTLLRDCFGEMPSRRVIAARLMVFAVLVGMSLGGMLLLLAWAWIAVKVFG